MSRPTLLLIILPLMMLAGCVQSGSVPVETHGHSGGQISAKSTNLEKDIRVMWSVTAKEEGRDWVAATPAAVLAAERVFNSVDLHGMTREAVDLKLRFGLRSPDYGYYAPFWPVARRDLPIRIDTGSYGWQFDVHFGSDQKVRSVTKRWIH